MVSIEFFFFKDNRLRKLETVEDTYWYRVSDLAKEVGILFLGFKPREKDKSKTKIKLYCKDHKLYWETTTIGNFLHRKKNPCKLCSKASAAGKIRESEESLLLRLESKLSSVGASFLRWDEDYKGILTPFTFLCDKHNEIVTNSSPRGLLESRYKTSGCKQCKLEGFGESINLNKGRHISEFMATGKYPIGTTFEKDRTKRTKRGVYNYWKITCGDCAQVNSIFIGSLKDGKVPCNCNPAIGLPEHKRLEEINTTLTSWGGKFLRWEKSFTNINSKFFWECKEGHTCLSTIFNVVTHKHGCRKCNPSGFDTTKPAYLYIVRWYGYCESWLKFGITNREVMDRISEQDTASKRLDYEILYTFYHESGQAVWDCEKLIKQSVQTSVCPKELLPDGYTETTNDNSEVLQQMLYIIEENL